MSEVRVPVLIVGGGSCGLVASTMLSNLGVEHAVVESHLTTAPLPRAHVLNQRTAEILGQHKLWDKITPHSTPNEDMRFFEYASSFAGDGPLDRFTFGRPACFGVGEDSTSDKNVDNVGYKRDSAYQGSNLPLSRLEPIFFEHARAHNPDRVLFNHTAVSFEEKDQHVMIEVINRATNAKTTFIAEYVIAADGGKTIGPALDIPFEGPRTVADATSVHFKADLSKYWHKGTLMYWLISVGGRGESFGPSPVFTCDWDCLVPMGPTWGPHSEEFCLHINLGQAHPPLELIDAKDIASRVRNILKIPDLPLDILKVSRWHIEAVTATKYQTERIFLAGDAAHRHPPTTGLGLNTGIGDVHNLTWKLAAVVKKQAPPSLLRTYESERLPIGRRNTKWALFTFMSLRVIDASIGLLVGGKAMRATNENVYTELLADDFNGISRRALVTDAIKMQRVEYAAHDLEIGGVYKSGALVPDGTVAPRVDSGGQKYTPTARPGHRLPHAWLQGASRTSTLQLLDSQGSWLLLTDSSGDGSKWIQEVAEIEKRSCFKIHSTRIGGSDAWEDENGQWFEDSGLEAGQGGVVLVRPDHYVVFRARKFSPPALSQLRKALSFEY